MNLNSSKWSKLSYWSKIVQIGPKLFQKVKMVQSGIIWTNMVQKGPKLSEIVQQYGPNWSEMVQKGPIGYIMVHYGNKLSKMAQNSHKESKIVPIISKGSITV